MVSLLLSISLLAPPLSRDRRYYGRRRKLFRQARPDFYDIEPNRRVSASFPTRGKARGNAPRVGITPRENARAPIRNTLGRTRNFANDSPSISTEREIRIPRSSLNPEISQLYNNGRDKHYFHYSVVIFILQLERYVN